jgi:hypothetical protein
MTCEIHLLQPGDLEELSRFLTSGFHTPADAGFAAPDVLAWKYLEPRGEPDDERPRSYVARDEAGTIVGHVGICRTRFLGPGLPEEGVPTLHMIDWLGSPGHPSVGASLMRRAHEGTPTQFGLGGSGAGRAVIKRGGYQPREPVPVYQRVLRPGQWLRVPGLSAWERAARLVRDTALLLRPRGGGPELRLQPTRSFGPEIEPIIRSAGEFAILTDRTPGRLNHLLRCPRQAISGWHLIGPDGRIAGFAVLNVLAQYQGRVRLGKVVDCLIGFGDEELWHGAFAALTKELARQGADVAQAFAGTGWTAEGLRRAGYRSRFALELSVRDRQGLIPPGDALLLTPLEADYAYT